MQRMRVRFSRGEEVKFISHLDIIRLWQRALLRAGIPLAYSEGFNPHPRISLAVPLAVGVTSEAELMDVFCASVVSPHWFQDAVSQQLLPGVTILQTYQLPLTIPSLQSMVRWAEYKVSLADGQPTEPVNAAITRILAANDIPWQHHRDTGVRNYNLRVLIDTLQLVELNADHLTIAMRLRCDSSGSGRPEQVAAALGFTEQPVSIHRTKLVLG